MSVFWGSRARVALRGFCSMRSLYIGLAASAMIAPGAMAQSANTPVNLDLGSVLATGTDNPANLVNTKGTAPYQSPSKAPLNSTQPTSLVDKHTVDNLLTGTESYADIARLTPSVSNINPNGPGLSETSGPTIRGFQDGEYNVTFDGIPFGDSNDFTHHSTSFFTNSLIGQTIVDRGPGQAETVGDATFGGTISLRTINPLPTPTATLNSSYGSYNTSDNSVRLDTGAISSLNGASAVFEAEHMQSDGALSYSGQQRTNFFGKVVIPLSPRTTLTLMADHNQLYQNPVYGATLSQMATQGWNYNLSGNPNSQNYYRFNNDHITTDMEYADLQSALGDGFLYDGKIYTYAYYHHDLNGDDTNDTNADGVTQAVSAGAVPNEVVLTPGGAAVAGIPGQTFMMDYRSVGTIQRLQKDFGWGDIKTGFWFDHQVNSRFVQNVSLTNANAVNYDPLDSNGGKGINTTTGAQLPGYDNANGSIERLQHNQLYTFQPYGQVDWHVTDKLTLTGGLKWAYFRRALNAQVNQKTELPTGYTHDYTKLLPSFDAKYAFSPNLTGYVQGAEGFLAPNLNTFYTTALTTESVKPESTINFQTGLAYQDAHWAVGGDIYNIHFQNYIASRTINKQKYYYNQGGVIYRGIEGELAYSFDNGITLFGNAGYNQAFKTSSEVKITQAPQGTANFGVIYEHNGIYASVLDQWTGGEYSGNNGTNIANGQAEGSAGGGKSPGGWYDPYNVVNVALGYTFNHDNPHKDPIKVKLNLDNITNQKQIIFDNGTNGAGDLLYLRLTGFSAFASVSVPVGFGSSL
ncbi:TonB-dependent outer membrane receptor FecA5 [Acidocella sp. MX-AZ02]|nr:TonB-dependent receptor [Acidocella sp. MX-AZ03]EKM98435.1 TonB-dependent outer membrane receptor FecA5 [Acidocella sp. MX-AZ02]WBO59193.1 TonB-dependent receptor [Acidocella sp. MX-AZ03]